MDLQFTQKSYHVIRFLLGALMAILVFLGSNGLYAQSGELDVNFNGSGKQLLQLQGTYPSVGTCTALQSDGKILVAGAISSGSGVQNTFLSVCRLFPDGSLDYSFGPNSSYIIYNLNGWGAQVEDMKVMADGSIMLICTVFFSETAVSVGLLKLYPDGWVDTNFGNMGFVLANLSGNTTSHCVYPLSTGKIMLCGMFFPDNGGDAQSLVMRYNADGSIDNSFSFDGQILFDFGMGVEGSLDLVEQNDGKVLITGYFEQSSVGTALLYRLQTDGTLDTGFGTNGKVISNIADYTVAACNVFIDNNQRIILVGTAEHLQTQSGGVFIQKYLMNGSLDNTFGTNGTMAEYMNLLSNYTNLQAVLQPDGKILVSGVSPSWNGSADFFVTRYEANGNKDYTFVGPGFGSINIDIANTGDYCYDMALQADGKILLCGTTYQPSGAYISVARLQNDITSTNINPPKEEVNSINLFPTIVSQDAFYLQYELEHTQDVEVWIYDSQGQKLVCLQPNEQQTGQQERKFVIPTNISNGLYYCHITLGNKMQTKAFMVIR